MRARPLLLLALLAACAGDPPPREQAAKPARPVAAKKPAPAKAAARPAPVEQPAPPPAEEPAEAPAPAPAPPAKPDLGFGAAAAAAVEKRAQEGDLLDLVAGTLAIEEIDLSDLDAKHRGRGETEEERIARLQREATLPGPDGPAPARAPRDASDPFQAVLGRVDESIRRGDWAGYSGCLSPETEQGVAALLAMSCAWAARELQRDGKTEGAANLRGLLARHGIDAASADELLGGERPALERLRDVRRRLRDPSGFLAAIGRILAMGRESSGSGTRLFLEGATSRPGGRGPKPTATVTISQGQSFPVELRDRAGKPAIHVNPAALERYLEDELTSLAGLIRQGR